MKLSFILGIVGVVLGLIVLIVGALIPFIVEHSITTTIEDGLPLKPYKWDREDWDNFLENNSTYELNVFNITNLQDVLSNGAKFQVHNVGPVKFTKQTKNFNVSWTKSGDKITYYSCTFLHVADAASEVRHRDRQGRREKQRRT